MKTNLPRLCLILLGGLLVLCCPAPAPSGQEIKPAQPSPAAIQFFENKVRPLLVENCFKCHGDKKPKAGLRLDSRAAILEGGDSGPAIVPGDPAKSLLVKAVS